MKDIEAIQVSIEEYRKHKIELTEAEAKLCQSIFLKVKERILELSEQGFIDIEDSTDISVCLPCAIYDLYNDDKWHYYKYMRMRKVIETTYAISLYDADSKKTEEHQISTTEQWINLFASLDCMNFWNDSFANFYH